DYLLPAWQGSVVGQLARVAAVAIGQPDRPAAVVGLVYQLLTSRREGKLDPEVGIGHQRNEAARIHGQVERVQAVAEVWVTAGARAEHHLGSIGRNGATCDIR